MYTQSKREREETSSSRLLPLLGLSQPWVSIAGCLVQTRSPGGRPAGHCVLLLAASAPTLLFGTEGQRAEGLLKRPGCSGAPWGLLAVLDRLSMQCVGKPLAGTGVLAAPVAPGSGVPLVLLPSTSQ